MNESAPLFELLIICVLDFENCSQWLSDVPKLKLWVVCPLASESYFLVSHVIASIEEYLFQVFFSPSSNY